MNLPIGVSDFKKLIEYKDPKGEGYLFVDKTLFIQELLYDLTEVIVFTRPRCFGKQTFARWALRFPGKTLE